MNSPVLLGLILFVLVVIAGGAVAGPTGAVVVIAWCATAFGCWAVWRGFRRLLWWRVRPRGDRGAAAVLSGSGDRSAEGSNHDTGV